MKKILIFSLAYYPDHVSGAEVAIKELTDRTEDIEFHMVTLRFNSSTPPVSKIGNVLIHRVGLGGAYLSKILFIPLAALKARSLNVQYHYDGLWAMMTYMVAPLMLAKILGVRAPYAVSLQDGDPYEKVFGRLRALPLLPLIDRGLCCATVVQAISTYLALWPARRGCTRDVIVIPNGASAESLQEYSGDELNALKEKVGKKEGDIFLVSVSRLVHQKAIDDIVRALPMLPGHVRLLVVGEGPDLMMLQKLSRELGVESRVIFAGYTSDRQMTAKYRRISDIFVLPSRSEGQGISFMSTMAAGIPIVATQEGGIADFLFDAKRNPDKPTTGFAVDKDSPGQIADAVKDILANPEKANEAVNNAKNLVEQEYNWDTIAKDMREKVFAKIL